MKQWIIVFWSFLLYSGIGVAQERFSKLFSRGGSEWIVELINYSPGDYLLINASKKIGDVTDSLFAIQVNSNGEKLQKKRVEMIDGLILDRSSNVHPLSNSGYLLTTLAYKEADGINFRTAYITKLTESLDTVWSRQYFRNGTQRTSVSDFYENDMGEIVTTGFTVIGESEGVGANFLILDPVDGSIILEKKVGDHNLCNPFNIAPTPDGGYLISGFADSPSSVQPNGNLRSGYLLKIDENGEKEWEKTYNNPHLEDYGQFFWDMKPTQDGNFLIMSTITTAIDEDGWSTDTDALVMKVNPMGEIIWQQEFGTKGDGHRTYLTSISEAEDGTIILGGDTTTDDGHKGLFYKLTPLGEIIWERYYRHEERIGSHYISKVLATADGGLIACGSSSSPQDGWLLKLDCNGCLDETCPLDGEECIPYDCAEDTPPLASFSLPEQPYNTTDEEPFMLTPTNESENATSYQWWLDDVLISEELAPELNLPSGQNYTLELVAYNQDCQDSYVTTFYVDNTLNTDANKKIVSPSVYPNPAKTTITIEYNFEQASQIELYEVSGKEILSHTVTAPTERVNLPLNTINKGVYFLKVTTPQQQYMFKVVKE